MNFEARAALKRPKVPHYLNMKMCMLGYQFAGKSTLAEKLANEFNLDIYKLEELVDLAIEFAEAHPEPIV